MIADGYVYALGADALLTAFDLENGNLVWQYQVNPPKSGVFPGIAGGIAVSKDKVAVHPRAPASACWMPKMAQSYGK